VGTAALGVLGKQRQVSKIEMTLDGDSIHIENPEKATVQTLLALFEAKHAGVAERITASSMPLFPSFSAVFARCLSILVRPLACNEPSGAFRYVQIASAYFTR
jgi:hypothetical protein